MDKHKLASGSLKLIRKDLMIDENFVIGLDKDPLQELEAFLIKQVQYLIDHDFGKLINAMYRVDVPEDRVKEIIEKSMPHKISENLAKCILDREKEKVISRKKYSS